MVENYRDRVSILTQWLFFNFHERSLLMDSVIRKIIQDDVWGEFEKALSKAGCISKEA